MATAAEKQHLKEISQMGCIACEMLGYFDTPSQVHHVRTKLGWGRDSHFDTIPLCERHHSQYSPYGVHAMGRSAFKKMIGYSEIELLAIVKKRMGK